MTATPLDLIVSLAAVPHGHDRVIAAIALDCPALGLKHSGDLLRDPLTEREREDLRWYLEEYWQWPYEQFLERARTVEALLQALGERLYNALFGSTGAQMLLQQWRFLSDAQQAPRQITVLSELPAVLSLPWELLRDEQGFLVLGNRPAPVVRRLEQRQLPGLPAQFAPPLRVLLVTARPENTGFVDPRGIARELLDEVQPLVEAGTLALELLRPPTLDALRKRLRDTARPVHVLHFDGHGVFQPGEGKAQPADDGLRMHGGGVGMLAFEKADATLDLVEAEKLGNRLKDSGISLAVLTACQSALSGADDAFSSVAGRLIKGGVPAVVAMSASVLVASAARYVEGFYGALADGQRVPVAHEQARQALYDNPERHVHRRNDDEPGQPVRLQDWWLPHLYQQRELSLVQEPTGNGQPASETVRPPEERLAAMPPPPRYGWSGRARELLQVERWLLQHKLVVLHGFGGQGKTALAREAADWLTRTGMFGGALFVSFEHGNGAAQLLAALGEFLGVYSGDYRPDDTRAALAKLRPALKQQRTLIVADNLESVLPRGEAPLPADERAALWEALLALHKAGAGLLLTSRDTAFGDGRLAPGAAVAHLQLGGLGADDAYGLASRLLEDLQIERSRAPFDGLRVLLRQLDYHPLAIQLVLPALRELPLRKITEEFFALLPRFVDDSETGRNRSLLASLDYSLRRLTPEQRALLPRLAPFEGGASEDDLLIITEIAEAEWAALRPALEQAALVRAEQVATWTAPFLQFHPVLAPYLRGLAGADDGALQTRYAGRYAALARYLYGEDSRNPQAVRALVRRELPNLRRAFDMLLASGASAAAVEMAEQLARFLNYFGLRRELAELRRKVEATTTTGAGGALTRAEYLRESGLGEDEYGRGELQQAYNRFAKLLARHEAMPAGTPLGSGSYEHSNTLLSLARCLQAGGQPAAAEQALRAALTIVEALIAQQPDNQLYKRQRGALLADLGDVLRAQGNFAAARAAYEQAQQAAKQVDDQRTQGVALAQLGALALQQRDYAEAELRYNEALSLFRALDEPAVVGQVWHQLGRVAEEQRQWAEAERCYRESITLREQLGDAAGVARTCNQLAIVAKNSGRPAEAEGWYKRALGNDERSNNMVGIARGCNNFANLLLDELRAGRADGSRLAEARVYGERALAIREQLDASSEIWKTLNILAGIATLEGRSEEVSVLRRRERETFAAFAGNRWHIDRQHGALIAAIVAATEGNAEARGAVEARLPQLEANGWRIAEATRRLWAGERDWHALCEELDSQDALLVKRVLEELG